jgi:TPR repeat protein
VIVCVVAKDNMTQAAKWYRKAADRGGASERSR